MESNVFYDDVRYRKSLANQSRHRKGARGGRKCNLPSDRMTEKQWKERCGKMVTYQMGVPLKWNDFKGMPKDVKEEYIRSLQEKYNANASVICEMLGVTPSYFSHYLTRENIDVEFTGKRMTQEQKAMFANFVGGSVVDAGVAAATDQIEEATADEEPAGCAETLYKPSCEMDGFSIRFSGKLDLSAIYNSLRMILGDATTGTIEVVWNGGAREEGGCV